MADLPYDENDLLSAVRVVFQPVVSLIDGTIAAQEAFVRGPEQIVLETPRALFAHARRHGLSGTVDLAAKEAAFQAVAHLHDPLPLFCNVDAEFLGPEFLRAMHEAHRRVAPQVPVIIEVSEPHLSRRPALLNQGIALVRRLGWGISIDNVGTDASAAALLSLIRPDVVKLDPGVIQRGGPAPHVLANIHGYIEATGATLIAKGVETAQDVMTARLLGATFAQGWLYGKPTYEPSTSTQPRARMYVLDPPVLTATRDVRGTAPVQHGTRDELREISIAIEELAQRATPGTAVLLSSFQHERNFTTNAAARYSTIAQTAAYVGAIGLGMPSSAAPGVRGGSLSGTDPRCDEWNVVLLTPQHAVALIAWAHRGHKGTMLYEYTVLRDRRSVTSAAHSLFGFITSDPPAPKPTTRPAARPTSARALEAFANNNTLGAVLVNPNLGIEWTNAAFANIVGEPTETILGTSLLHLVHPDDAVVLGTLFDTSASAQSVEYLDRPRRIRVRRRDSAPGGDGHTQFVELDATGKASFGDPSIRGGLVLLRAVPDILTLHAAVDALNQTGDIKLVLSLVLDYIEHAFPEAYVSVVHEDALGLIHGQGTSGVVEAGIEAFGALQGCLVSTHVLPGEDESVATRVAKPILLPESGRLVGAVTLLVPTSTKAWSRNSDVLDRAVAIASLAIARSHSTATQPSEHVDPLTGLLTRAGFDAALASRDNRAIQPTDTAISGAFDGEPPRVLTCWALLYIGVTGIDIVNREHGTDAGDQVLAEVGRRLDNLTRAGDLAARVGGVDFTLLCSVKDTKLAQQVSDRVVAVLGAPITLPNGSTATIAPKVSVAFTFDDPTVEGDLVMKSDKALTEAKEAGKHAWPRVIDIDDAG